jgi:hypothetical protein
VERRRTICDNPVWREQHARTITDLIELETPTCPAYGQTAILVVDEKGFDLYLRGASIRHAFVTLTTAQREGLADGAHADCSRPDWTGSF